MENFSLIGTVILAGAFLAGMLVGSNNPTWLNSKWKEIKAKAEQAKSDEAVSKISKEVLDYLKNQGVIK